MKKLYLALAGPKWDRFGATNIFGIAMLLVVYTLAYFLYFKL